jgi:protoporphyrinogen/coproporphyrinogen III oxidase
MPRARNVLVIGGGISGLACAYKLKRLGVDVELFESTDRVGGLVRTVDQDGFQFESGPQSLLGTAALLDLIRELGVEGELLQANPRAPRYVLRGGRLQRLPMSPPALFTSSLLGLGSRWKILSEPFRHTKPPDHEESVAEFARRKFGREILEYLVSPFVSGVYAGDPEKLSVSAAFPDLEQWERKYGSILRGAIKSRPARGERKGMSPLCSFRRGLGTLIEGLANGLGDALHMSVCAQGLKRTSSTQADGFEIQLARQGGNETIPAAAVVLATPACVTAKLVEPLCSSLGQTLSAMPYAPVAVVAAGYSAQQFAQPPNGFGFLIPRSENLRTLGTVWNSSLFARTAPPGCVAITSFVGGATDTEMVEKSDEEILRIVNGENARIMGFTGQPRVSAIWKHAKALPQYNLGHGKILEKLRRAEREVPGLFFSGNYLEGPAVGKCVEQASRTADAVREYLRSSA